MDKDDDTDRYWTHSTGSEKLKAAGRFATTTSRIVGPDRSNWIRIRAHLVLSSYRKDDLPTPDGFCNSHSARTLSQQGHRCGDLTENRHPAHLQVSALDRRDGRVYARNTSGARPTPALRRPIAQADREARASEPGQDREPEHRENVAERIQREATRLGRRHQRLYNVYQPSPAVSAGKRGGHPGTSVEDKNELASRFRSQACRPTHSQNPRGTMRRDDARDLRHKPPTRLKGATAK